MSDEYRIEYTFDPETWEGVYREWADGVLIVDRPAHLSEIADIATGAAFEEPAA